MLAKDVRPKTEFSQIDSSHRKMGDQFGYYWLQVCTAHPYTVCRGEDYCTPALSHEEAIRASEIKKTWKDEKLYVRPVKNREPM